jgi:hypothetical protein
MWKLAIPFGRHHDARPPFLARARRLPRRLEERADAQRTAALESRTSALISDLAAARPTAAEAGPSEISYTMRVAWELVAGLRASLLSLEERATRVVPAQVAGLIALWTQIHTFDRAPALVLIWGAWATEIVAILILAHLVMPSRLAKFWAGLIPPEVVLAELKPLSPDDEGAIAARMSATLHAQIDRLRRGFRLAVGMSTLALVLTAVGYVIERS